MMLSLSSDGARHRSREQPTVQGSVSAYTNESTTRHALRLRLLRPSQVRRMTYSLHCE